ncbi:MAG: tRNA (adenosine(37)-N6)-threonylcarbamoyltransferase complex ATPase subunit type 1 TsaE [Alphaproteobacteria bacterium]|nr:tRNA (adenosine(37)-N6)-threonylcarbamoyltransferase complex ATPase subunit type 1 TsaE [Alphaproteobacteria bacterium]
MRWIIHDEKELMAIAATIAPKLKAGDVIALHGTLGVGKTTFVRALIRYLNKSETEVPSPTFTLLQMYDTANFTIYHFDFYRLKRPDEAYEIGIEDAFELGVSLIEWPDKIGSLLPKKHKSISFEMLPDNTRIIETEDFDEDA